LKNNLITKQKNMNKDYTRYIAATVGVIVTTAIVAGSSYAYQGGFDDKEFGNLRQRGQEMLQTLENKDYTSWKKMMEEKQSRLMSEVSALSGKINEETFNKLLEVNQLIKDGKYAEAQALEKEIGLPGMRLGMSKGFKKGLDEETALKQHAALRQAVESGDYETWKALMGDNPITQKITAENFSKLSEANKLMQAGKFAEAKKLREELGFGFGRGMETGVPPKKAQ